VDGGHAHRVGRVRVHVGPRPEEDGGGVRVVEEQGQLDGGEPVRCGGVGVGAAGEQGPDLAEVAGGGRLGQGQRPQRPDGLDHPAEPPVPGVQQRADAGLVGGGGLARVRLQRRQCRGLVVLERLVEAHAQVYADAPAGRVRPG
jgi:hypothetical protein